MLHVEKGLMELAIGRAHLTVTHCRAFQGLTEKTSGVLASGTRWSAFAVGLLGWEATLALEHR